MPSGDDPPEQGRRPLVILDPASVSEAERDGFRERGFAVVPRLIDDHVVAELRAGYDDIISGRIAARGDRRLGDVIRQVKDPSLDHPVFAANAAVDAGVRLAAGLFGHGEYDRAYEMLIDKPSGTVSETPWHEDVGYFGRPVTPAGADTDLADIQVWVALDDVDVANGCMQYLPRAVGAPSLAHRVASGDPDDEGRLIEIDGDLDTAAAVACPLAAGGATVHTVGAPHFTGANLTDRPRRAYIFNIGPRRFSQSVQAAVRAGYGLGDT
ncbi:MAG: phytanoyl-CoA dioxygenase family protein [Actinomycetota bacterium]